MPIRADGVASRRDEDFRVAFTSGDLAAESKVTIADSTKPADKPKPGRQPQAAGERDRRRPARRDAAREQQSLKGPCISKRRFTIRLARRRRGTVKLGGKG